MTPIEAARWLGEAHAGRVALPNAERYVLATGYAKHGGELEGIQG